MTASEATSDENRPVKINLQVVVFNAADLTAESTFWARLLGGTVDAENNWHMVLLNGEPRVGVQLARPTSTTRVAGEDSTADTPRSVGRRLRASSRRSHVRRREVASSCSMYRSLPTIFRSTRIRLAHLLLSLLGEADSSGRRTVGQADLGGRLRARRGLSLRRLRTKPTEATSLFPGHAPMASARSTMKSNSSLPPRPPPRRSRCGSPDW